MTNEAKGVDFRAIAIQQRNTMVIALLEAERVALERLALANLRIQQLVEEVADLKDRLDGADRGKATGRPPKRAGKNGAAVIVDG